MCLTGILAQCFCVYGQATVHKLAKTLKACDNAAADELSQLCELSAQACSLLFHQVSNNLPGLILGTNVNQEDLIPVTYATKTSALLVSHQQTQGHIAGACICVHAHIRGHPTIVFISQACLMLSSRETRKGKAEARYCTACIC